MSVNGIGAGYIAQYSNTYKTKKSETQQTFQPCECANTHRDTDVLGIGFLSVPGTNMKYGMKAEYADDYSADNPVIKVTVQTLYGAEEHHINVREVNPGNASEIEMFALCNYADAAGQGTGGTFGSWQTLKYYSNNAVHNGYFEKSDTTELFQSLKQDWTSMVKSMINDYRNGGLYKQALDGNKLLDLFNRSALQSAGKRASAASDEKETETKSDIVVKPDGSRVLVVTTSIGGMETTMSLEITKPTDSQNDNLKQENENNGTRNAKEGMSSVEISE